MFKVMFNNMLIVILMVTMPSVMMMMTTTIESSTSTDDTSTLSLNARDIPTDTSQTINSYSNTVIDKSPENTDNDKVDNIVNDIKTTTSNIVLKPNIGGAVDVGDGLLVPLVPIVDPSTKNNNRQVSPLIANLLPVTIENVTRDVNMQATDAEIQSINDDMAVAEDIIFRPLFRYRQEASARRKLYNNEKRYYQPYIYAYKSSRKNNYYNDNNEQRLNYNPYNNYH